MPDVVSTPVAAPPPTRVRWGFIDTLRGFALCGILLVNSLDISRLGLTRLEQGGRAIGDPIRDALYLGVQTRFVPIFVVLFGMSLYFVLEGARARARRPWLVLIRRMVALVAIGALLGLVYPGNILIDLGVVGLLAIPVALFVPRRFTLALGALLTVAAFALFGGGELSTPGLMLLGVAAAEFGAPERLEHAGRSVAIVLAVAVVVSVPLIAWQLTTPGDPRFSTPGGIAGLALAVVYATGLALAWRTPARRVLRAIFEPLGRMALTNYIGAAIAVAVAATLADFGAMTSALPALALSVGILGVQSVLSRLWLRRFAYGPVEWVWRMVTSWSVVPLRRA